MECFHCIRTLGDAEETHLCLAARWPCQHGGLGHRQVALVLFNTVGHVCPVSRW